MRQFSRLRGEKMREIRFLNESNLPEYLPIYLNSYPANKSIGDEGYEKYMNRCSKIMKSDKGTRYVGLYEDEVLIAVMKIIEFKMNIFGKMERATGLMALGVHPMHKKKGAALDMVRFFEEYTMKIGATVALLLPFRIDFYRKMGYGFITRLYEYHLLTNKMPKGDVTKLRLLEKADFQSVLGCYNSLAASYHGMLEKFGEEARDMEEDSEIRRIGYWDNDKLVGYAAFNFVSDSDVNYTKNYIDVTELVYKDGEVLKSLLSGLRLQADLAQKVVIRTGEEDFYHLIEDPADVNENYIDYGYLETNIAAVGVMGKILDYEKFVEETSYRNFPPIEMIVKFKTRDELEDKEKTFAVAFRKKETGETSTWSLYDYPKMKSNVSEKIIKEDMITVEIGCREGDLAALLLGGVRFGSMLRLGIASIDKKEKAFLIDALFSAYQAPFTNTDF